jgi:acetoin utilization deacetylase AcuC-like enzyme
MEKYRLLRERVANELPEVALHEPIAASDEVLCLAHTPDYVSRLCRGDLSRKEMQRIGFPWSAEMVERSRRSTGATIMACEHALREGVSINLAGGTHHAYADRGEGFCCFNDAVVAARLMQAKGLATRIAIIDLDVHQGNGTAHMAQHDPRMFTISLHGAGNYPFVKERSDIDVELADGCGDSEYLSALGQALLEFQARFPGPDLMVYLAGADPFEGDRLGRLALSKSGLRCRDEAVFGYCRKQGVPIAVAMAGGYSEPISHTVDIHFQTVSCALQNYRY